MIHRAPAADPDGKEQREHPCEPEQPRLVPRFYDDVVDRVTSFGLAARSVGTRCQHLLILDPAECGQQPIPSHHGGGAELLGRTRDGLQALERRGGLGRIVLRNVPVRTTRRKPRSSTDAERQRARTRIRQIRRLMASANKPPRDPDRRPTREPEEGRADRLHACEAKEPRQGHRPIPPRSPGDKSSRRQLWKSQCSVRAAAEALVRSSTQLAKSNGPMPGHRTTSPPTTEASTDCARRAAAGAGSKRPIGAGLSGSPARLGVTWVRRFG